MKQKGFNNIGLSVFFVSFKIFTKVSTIRMNSVVDHVVHLSQTTFMQDCNILDRVVILHETVHRLYRKRLNVVILKFYSEKAYNEVKLYFLQHTLRMKDFFELWRVLIHSFVLEGSVAIKVHYETVKYFEIKKGLR
jgi:hypothetical protein